MTDPPSLPCPRCGVHLPDGASAGVPIVACPSCGHQMDAAVLREAQALVGWQRQASQRLQWLTEQLAEQLAGPTIAGPISTGAAPALRTSAARPVTPPVKPPGTPPGSGGSVVLAAGVVLLVLAGVAFLAFTWHLLGPIGQIAVLLALGALCLWLCGLLLGALRGTAVSLGVVGVLLIGIADLGTRLLGPDHVGELASLVAAVVVALGLIAVGVRLRVRTAGVAELASGFGWVLMTGFMATAPGDDAIPVSEPWTWWVALVAAASGSAMLVLANRFAMRTWPVIASGWLVIASIAFGVWIAEATDHLSVADRAPLAFALAVAATAPAVSLAFGRLTRHRLALTVVMLIDWSLAVLVAWFHGIGSGDARGWTALVLAVVGALGVAPRVLNVWPAGLRRLTTVTGMLVMASAVGMGIPPYVRSTMSIDAVSWANQAWPPWRGFVAGTAFVGVLVLTVIVARTAPSAVKGLPPPLTQALPVATTAVALGTWLVTAQADRQTVTAPSYTSYQMDALPTPTSFTRQIAVALAIVAIGLLVAALLRAAPTWAVWLLPVLAVPAALMQFGTLSLSAPTTPELVGAVIAVPTVVAAAAWRWLRRPASTPTWQTITPAFVITVLPSTIALLDDTTDRWWYGSDPATAYQLRMVGLLAVGVLAAVAGARQRWIGLFVPGLVLALLIASVELIDLGRFLPQWVSFAVAGALLIAAGARWEWLRNQRRTGATWMGTMR